MQPACFLCEKVLDRTIKRAIVRVGGMGPHRRAHGDCFAKIMTMERDQRHETDNPLWLLERVEAREQDRGIDSPPRDPAIITEMHRAHKAYREAQCHR